MPTVTPELVKRFGDACSWTYEAWTLHRALFDDSPEAAVFRTSKHAYFLQNVSIITQEYALLQLAKLHDPPGKGEAANLTIAYFVKFGKWTAETAARLRIPPSPQPTPPASRRRSPTYLNALLRQNLTGISQPSRSVGLASRWE